MLVAALAGCSYFLPPPRAEGTPAPCASAPGQTELISQLADGGLQVVALYGSKWQPVIGASATVCYVKIRNAAFEAAFFVDASAVEQFRVCETHSGSHYLYRVNSKTVDGTNPVYWRRAGTVVIWAFDQDVDKALRTALRTVSIPC